jgi:hypothetical protein
MGVDNYGVICRKEKYQTYNTILSLHNDYNIEQQMYVKFYYITGLVLRVVDPASRNQMPE